MRITIEIDDDVLQAVTALATFQGRTVGQVVSAVLRHELGSAASTRRVRNGVPQLPRRATGRVRPTMRLVNALRDDP